MMMKVDGGARYEAGAVAGGRPQGLQPRRRDRRVRQPGRRRTVPARAGRPQARREVPQLQVADAFGSRIPPPEAGSGCQRSRGGAGLRSLTMASVLDRFSEAARTWFTSSFAAPTPAQEQGWEAISKGHHTLILAPTGSGKTLAAFFWALDRLAVQGPPPDEKQRLKVLYVSPLKALTYDVERNLRAPLVGMGATNVRVGTRTGDTTEKERRDIAPPPARHPRDDAGVALPHAHVAGTRGAGVGGARDHRRDPRDGGHQAGRPPGAVARAPRQAVRVAARNASACRRRSVPSRRSPATSADATAR